MARKILLADDSISIQKVINVTFPDKDFEVIPVMRGDEVIHEAKKIHPDIILVDSSLQDMDGYEVCRQIKRDPELEEISVLLMIGESESYDEQKGAEAGIDGFISKPFESKLLIHKVMELIDLTMERTVKLDLAELETLDTQGFEAPVEKVSEEIQEEPIELGEPEIEEDALELGDIEEEPPGELDVTSTEESIPEFRVEETGVQTDEIEGISLEEELGELEKKEGVETEAISQDEPFELELEADDATERLDLDEEGLATTEEFEELTLEEPDEVEIEGEEKAPEEEVDLDLSLEEIPSLDEPVEVEPSEAEEISLEEPIKMELEEAKEFSDREALEEDLTAEFSLDEISLEEDTIDLGLDEEGLSAKESAAQEIGEMKSKDEEVELELTDAEEILLEEEAELQDEPTLILGEEREEVSFEKQEELELSESVELEPSPTEEVSLEEDTLDLGRKKEADEGIKLEASMEFEPSEMEVLEEPSLVEKELSLEETEMISPSEEVLSMEDKVTVEPSETEDFISVEEAKIEEAEEEVPVEDTGEFGPTEVEGKILEEEEFGKAEELEEPSLKEEISEKEPSPLEVIARSEGQILDGIEEVDISQEIEREAVELIEIAEGQHIELLEVSLDSIPSQWTPLKAELSHYDFGLVDPFSPEAIRSEIDTNLKEIVEKVVADMAPPIVEKVARDIALQRTEEIIREEIERIKATKTPEQDR